MIEENTETLENMPRVKGWRKNNNFANASKQFIRLQQ